ncbi:unnamed protein product [Phytomonas sp. Hart1]|nr:unnamed protein product [Phytomonas sp. Hart1]|eukprot:CCW67455.1 unnamed protein product [Phytomonas sp. isolate Hart1]
MVSTNSSNQTLHSRGSTDIESSHHKRYSSLGRNNKRSISIELDSFSKGEMDVYLWISDLETAVRDHITRVEVSERHTVFEMMALNYMNFVLKPEIDYLMKIERTSRGGILFEEEKARDQLLHQTPLVCTIAEEMRAHLKRSLKMTKLDALRREKELNPITNSTNIVSTHLRTDKRNSEASPEDDARRIVQRYLKAKRRQIDEKGGDSNNGNIHCPSIQMRHSFSAFVQAMGTVEDVPDPNLLLFSEGSRRLSNPTVPLINSVRGIGRKAIGISELVPLIDKVTVEHRALVRSEQEERQSIMEMARNEAEGVVKWEHKRMHLERLFFWREQRYRALGEDLRNTVEEMVCKFRAKSIDPAVEAQLRLCEKAENTARIGIDNEEKTFRVLLSTRHDKLYQLYYRNGLVKAYKKAWEETYSEALLGFSGFIVENEKKHRIWIHVRHSKWISLVVGPRLKMLKCLYAVSINASKYNALLILQRAFRRSLSGQLHWRFSNRMIGREIRKKRDIKRIELGREAMNAFRAQLNSERALMEKEVAEQYARLRYKLLLEERDLREALLMQEKINFALMEWEYHEGFRTEVRR